MKNNTVIASNGSEIYTDEIMSFADDYISTLNKPEDIYKKQCFVGMIKYIANQIKSRVDIDNLVLLDNLWNIYASLCYKYNHVITIERYCILINNSKLIQRCLRESRRKVLARRFTQKRKMYISKLIDSGLNIDEIRRLVGHADERTTFSSYCFNRLTDIQTEEKIEAALGNKKVIRGNQKIAEFVKNKNPENIEKSRISG